MFFVIAALVFAAFGIVAFVVHAASGIVLLFAILALVCVALTLLGG